jgi:hypothetical protein
MTEPLAPTNLAEWIPPGSRPDNVEALLAAALAVTTVERVAEALAGVRWGGRGPGYAAAVLRRLAEPGTMGEGSRGARPTRAGSPAGAAAGRAGPVRAHPYRPSLDVPGYCGRCGLPERNGLHGI